MANWKIESDRNGTKLMVPIVLPDEAALGQAKAALARITYPGFEVLEADQVFDTSKITGQPIFMALQFDPVTYTDENNNRVSLNGLYVPVCIVEINFKKTIVETAVAGTGYGGVVFEYVNIGVFELTIKGMLMGVNGVYPEADVKTLNQYRKCNKQFGLTHPILRMLDIYEVILRGGGLEHRSGMINCQAFSFTCSEDKPFVMELKAAKSLTQ